MANVLLISSLFTERIWHYYPELPLGLAYIATAAINKGHNVQAIDLNVSRNPYKNLKSITKKMMPDHVGISCTYGSLNNALISADLIRQIRPSCKIYLGGLPATFIHDHISQKSDAIDVYIIGEGEETFIDLLDGNKYSTIPGIIYKKDHALIKTEKRSLISNLDNLGLPSRHLFPLKKYKIQFKLHSSTIIETTRGCPYCCDFCTQGPKEGTEIRSRSISMIMKELEDIKRHQHIRRIMIVDNDFLSNHPDVNGVLDAIIQNDFNQHFFFFFATRVETLIKGGDDLLQKLIQTNVRTIFVGIESISTQNIHHLKKITSLSKTYDIIKKYLNNKIDIMPSYMIGFSNENRSDILETINFAKKINTKNVNINILTPYPGTKLFERDSFDNNIQHFDFNLYDNCHQITAHQERLEKIFLAFHRKYYLRYKYLNLKRNVFFQEFNLRRISMFLFYILTEIKILTRSIRRKITVTKQGFDV